MKEKLVVKSDQEEALDIRRFWEERFTAHPDLTGAGAVGNRLHFVEFMYRARMRQVERGLRACGLTDLTAKRVLDVGSGSGAWLDFWRRHGAAQVVGMDFAASSVRLLQARFPGMVIAQADICQAPFPIPDQTYDLISAFDVLMHIFDPARFGQAIANLAAYCAPGGWLIISDPIVAGQHYVPSRSGSAYVRMRTLAEYRQALVAGGFVLRAVRPATVLLNSPLEARSKTAFTLQSRWWRLCRKGQAVLDFPWPVGGLAWWGALYADALACALSQNGRSPTSKLLFAQKVS